MDGISLWKCFGRCFGSHQEQPPPLEQHDGPRMSLDRAIRIEKWVREGNITCHENVLTNTIVEDLTKAKYSCQVIENEISNSPVAMCNGSNKKLHEKVEPDTNSEDAVTVFNDGHSNAIEQHSIQEGTFRADSTKANNHRHQCRQNRSNVMEWRESIDTHNTPGHHNPCRTRPESSQHTPRRCMADTFPSMVPDVIKSISDYTPRSMPQNLSVPTWFSTECTAKRKNEATRMEPPAAPPPCEDKHHARSKEAITAYSTRSRPAAGMRQQQGGLRERAEA